MECAFLERKHIGDGKFGAGAFGKDPQRELLGWIGWDGGVRRCRRQEKNKHGRRTSLGAHLVPLHGGADLVKGFHGVFAVFSVDEDCTAKEHVLSEQGRKFELLLCHDACHLWEDFPEVEDIDARLVIANEDAGLSLAEVLLSLNGEADAGEGANE